MLSLTASAEMLALNPTSCAAAGKFPVLTVQTIVDIAAQAEKVFDHRYHFDLLMEQSLYAGADNLGASPAGARLLRGKHSSLHRSPAMLHVPPVNTLVDA